MLESVCKAGRVLDLFTSAHPDWGLTEIATELRIAKSSASDLMATLDSIGLVRRTPDRRYRLGWGIVALHRTLIGTTDLLTVARPVLAGLAEHGVAQLAVLRARHAVLIEATDGRSRGATVPTPTSAVGMALLAKNSPTTIAEDIGTTNQALACIAAPVRDGSGVVVAAIGLTVATRTYPGLAPRLRGLARHAAVEITDGVRTGNRQLSAPARG